MWTKSRIQIGPDTEITSQLIDDLIADENWVCLGMAITKLINERDELRIKLKDFDQESPKETK